MTRRNRRGEGTAFVTKGVSLHKVTDADLIEWLQEQADAAGGYSSVIKWALLTVKAASEDGEIPAPVPNNIALVQRMDEMAELLKMVFDAISNGSTVLTVSTANGEQEAAIPDDVLALVQQAVGSRPARGSLPDNLDL